MTLSRAAVVALVPVLLCAAAAVALVGARTPPASATEALLVPAFTVKNDAVWTRDDNVVIGDRGSSPFFTPAVLVWDGGSIIGGGTLPDEDDFARQTMRLLDRPVRNYESISGHALIADMLAEAPVEVDALYDPDADVNVCLVHAGGGDIRLGRDVGAIYEDLRLYCEGRRAAGMKVVVVTLLPRRDPAFEEPRLAFNTLVRDTWPEFADGLADVGADSRVGETWDHLYPKYYRPDALHITPAGYTVMAAVTAPALQRLEWRSDACLVRIGNEDGTWTDWRPYRATSRWVLSPGDGKKTVTVEYRDAGGAMVPAADSIRLDSVPPTTHALKDVVGRSGSRVYLPYRVDDALPCAPRIDVTVRVRSLDGSSLVKLTYLQKTIAVPHTASFVCRLAPGKYRYYVYARDAAGNPQSVIGSRALTVR